MDVLDAYGYVVKAAEEAVPNNCAECPFAQSEPFDSWFCKREHGRRLTVPARADAPIPPPDWCPLRVAPVLVRLEVKP